MTAKEEKEEKEKAKAEEVITAVYKVNLHCPQCASKIKKPLLRTQGVHSVEIDKEKKEVKVKGVIDVIKIHKKIEELSKKKVELISPQIKITEKVETEKSEVKEIKEEIIRTTSVKVHLHCEKCEQDLRRKLLKNKGIYSVKSDIKAQTLTVKGTIEPEKLLTHIRKKVHKYAEIITSEEEKKEEKKDEKEEKKDEKEEKKDEKEEKKDEKEEKKENVKAEAKSAEKTKTVELKEVVKVEVQFKEPNAPYFIHYVYAPQLFSDENPNACTIS